MNIRTIDCRVGQGWMRAATECVRGHIFDEANTHYNEEGWRRCRTCHNLRKRVKRPEAVG